MQEELRGQLSVYSEKFNSFQETLNKSNEVFDTFKKEMARMTKTIKSLEKENHKYVNPSYYYIYPLFTPYIHQHYLPNKYLMCTRYTCIYFLGITPHTVYKPNTPLNTPYTPPFIRPKCHTPLRDKPI